MSGILPLALTLPWPPRVLSPNARVHWNCKAKAAKQYRNTCAYVARQQGAKRLNVFEKVCCLHLALVFVPPTRRAFDLDNALASMKSGLDGLADVLQVDDSQWALSIAKAPAGQVGGTVKVTVTQQSYSNLH